MKKLPSVNHLVEQVTQHVKTASEMQKQASVSVPVYESPLTAELQKVAVVCRNGSASVSIADVKAFAERVMGDN